MSGTAYTWKGASGDSWNSSGSWETSPGTNDGTAPGSIDFATFVAFDGSVTGSVAAQALYVGAASDVTLDGSGFFGQVTMGWDLVNSPGAATLEVASGRVIAATLVNFGVGSFGTGTIVADGTFSVSSALMIGNPSASGTVKADNGGLFATAGNVTMMDGSTIDVAALGQVVVGNATGPGVSGAVDILAGHNVTGVGVIKGSVADYGTLGTDNSGLAPNTLSVTGNIAGTGSLSVANEMDIGGSIAAGVTASLFGINGAARGILRLAQPSADLGTLDTMSTGSTIELTGLSFASAVWSQTDNTLTMTGASGTLTLATMGTYTGRGFVTQADAAIGGTDVVVTAACFAEGTHIATDAGDVPVEAIRPGMRVRSAFGGCVEVVWVGRRRVDCRRHPRPHDVWPVRIASGAFGPRMPDRPLWLSPDHAVFVEDAGGGGLIPVRYLLNGATIRQVPVDHVTYFHVEAPMHDVILADGLPAESYLDTGNRSAFDGDGRTLTLHPDFALRVWEEEACADLVHEGPRLVAARARLIARAEILGWHLTDAPGLSLLADGAALRARVRGASWRARVPRGAGTVWLRSRAQAPVETWPDSADARRLGVAVAGLRFDGAEDDGRLGAGWHAAEGGWRWTDGDAALDVRRVREVAFRLALSARYWVEGEAEEQRMGERH
jgi:hypothetical protein